MEKKFLLIGESDLKENSLIEVSVSPKILETIILDVQKTQLRAILGKGLYKSLIDECEEATENETPLSEDTKDMLVDYIIPFLIHSVQVEFFVTNNYKLTNKGVQKMTDTSSASLSSDELEYVKNYYDNKLAGYKSALIDYLCEKNKTAPDQDDTISDAATGWHIESPSIDRYFTNGNSRYKYI